MDRRKVTGAVTSNVSFLISILMFGAAVLIPASIDAVNRHAFKVADYIEVKALKIEDTPQGAPVHMQVIRDLKADFPGYYSVTIRNAAGGEVICATGDIDINFRRVDSEGKATRLPDPLDLTWWSYGGSCTATVKAGLPAGVYSLETCHGHRHPPGFHGERQKTCWPVTIFRILPPIG